MNIKERLKRQLLQARQLSEQLLADFRKPEHWVYQVHENCNHALWFAGHMAHVDNFFISLVAPAKAISLPPLYSERFGMGSQPTGSLADYPPPSDVVARMRERRESLLAVLDSLTEEDLSKPSPEGAPAFLADFGSVFEMAIWHEGLHSGQLSSSRRALGFGPVMSGGDR